MKILLLDVYPNKPYRISKDQNGSYGTANNYGYGKSLVSRLLRSFVKKSIDFPPLYIVQTAGELTNSGHIVSYEKNLNLNEKYDLYIMPSSIVCHETEIEIIQTLIKNHKNVIVVGPFATTYPEPYLKAGAKVIKGEPEMFFHKFDKDIEYIKKLPNIIENLPLIDLDKLSIPDWKIIFKNYIPKMKFIGKGPVININASRGCPYSCFYYCVYPLQQGRKLRLKSPEKLLNEMIYFNDNLNVKNFIFRDPVFSINKEHTKAVCQKIIESGRKFNICIETHLKDIDDNLAMLFKRTGINLIYVGIESIDENVKENAHRVSENEDNQIKKIRYLEKIGIRVKAMYIVGLPADTINTYAKTFDYAKKVKSTYAQFNVFTPYPGTPVYKEYEDKIFAKKFEEFTQCQLVFKHKNLRSEDITKMLDNSYKNYYTNPSWILKYIYNKIKNTYENLHHGLFRFSR